MMKICAFSLRSVKPGFVKLGVWGAVALLASGAAEYPKLEISGIGEVDAKLAELKDKAQPWRAFHEDGSILTVVRAQLWNRPAGKSCAVYLNGIRSVPDGHVIPSVLENLYQSMTVDQLPDLPIWEPFRKEEIKAIEDCDDFPCKVKLNARENKALRTTSKNLRKKMWMAISVGRAERYRKIGMPEGYEADGLPVETWTKLESLGFRSLLPRAPEIELLIRLLHFSDDRVRPVRQIIDRRHSVGPKSAVMWGRAVYSDHYLDSWGEVVMLDCPAPAAPLRIVHGLIVDLDLLKKGGIFARMMRWKARDAFHAQASKYLDEVAAYIQAK